MQKATKTIIISLCSVKLLSTVLIYLLGDDGIISTLIAPFVSKASVVYSIIFEFAEFSQSIILPLIMLPLVVIAGGVLVFALVKNKIVNSIAVIYLALSSALDALVVFVFVFQKATYALVGGLIVDIIILAAICLYIIASIKQKRAVL